MRKLSSPANKNMSYKNKEDAAKYYREYYQRVKKPKIVHHPKVKKTHEEKLATKRAWYHANLEKVREMSKKSREKHKEQRKADTKAWIERNKEKHTEYRKKYLKEWYQRNKEKHDIKGKIWSSNPENKKKRVKYVQKYTAKNKEKVYTYGKSYNRTINGKFRYTKGSATRRGYEFLLSIDEFAKIIFNPCFYCGESKGTRGIDRVDNSIGYTKENSAPCCKICNYMKRIMTKEQFLEKISEIFKHNF